MRHALSVALAVAFASCQAAPAPAMPDGTGKGLVQSDATPPGGASIWHRPAWRVGDRLVLVRGERQRGEFVVTTASDAYYGIDAGNGVEIRRDLDLGNLGEWQKDGAALHEMTPVDSRYHWPLWVGKRWSCEFMDRTLGGPALLMRADYLVEDLDTVTVPAGTFSALRIVRKLSLVGMDDKLTRWHVSWYAPDVGTEVRQVHGDTLVELAGRIPAR